MLSAIQQADIMQPCLERSLESLRLEIFSFWNLMSPIEITRKHLLGSAATKREIANSTTAQIIVDAAASISRSVMGGGKLLLCGNGGSAADAQHIATEFTCRLQPSVQRPGIPAIALSTDTSFLTACANDFGFDAVFERLVDCLGRSGDVLIALSTSGLSANVLRAVSRAREKQILTIGLTGGTGGTLTGTVDLSIVVPSHSTQYIQEAHTAIGHIICQLVETALFPRVAALKT
jgi:D-sedoheptulose 7-phosphate isomerase